MLRLLLIALIGGLVLAPRAAAWSWPAEGAVLKPFVFDPNHPYAGGQHRGIDVAGSSGADVLAPAGGLVSFAGSVPSSGKIVTIQTPDGYSVTLVHLGSIAVSHGASVAEGSAVGTIGSSGDAEWPEPYVHLGIRVTADPQGYLDPLAFLPPRLVPMVEPPAGQSETADPVSATAVPPPTLTDVAAIPMELPPDLDTLMPTVEAEALTTEGDTGTAPAVATDATTSAVDASSALGAGAEAETGAVVPAPVATVAEPPAPADGPDPITTTSDMSEQDGSAASDEAAPAGEPTATPPNVGNAEPTTASPGPDVEETSTVLVAAVSAVAEADTAAIPPITEPSAPEPAGTSTDTGAPASFADEATSGRAAVTTREVDGGAAPGVPTDSPAAVAPDGTPSTTDAPAPGVGAGTANGTADTVPEGTAGTGDGASSTGASIDANGAQQATTSEGPVSSRPTGDRVAPHADPREGVPSAAAQDAEAVAAEGAASRHESAANAVVETHHDLSAPVLRSRVVDARVVADALPRARNGLLSMRSATKNAATRSTGAGGTSRPPRPVVLQQRRRADRQSDARAPHPAAEAAIAPALHSDASALPMRPRASGGVGPADWAYGLGIAAGIAALALLGRGFGRGVQRGRRRPELVPPIQLEQAIEDEFEEDLSSALEPLRCESASFARRKRANPRRRCVAVRGRTAPHRSCGGVRSLRRLRALPPPARQRRADGVRDRRARDARDGGRRSRRVVAA
jgi:Peptidase family M23